MNSVSIHVRYKLIHADPRKTEISLFCNGNDSPIISFQIEHEKLMALTREMARKTDSSERHSIADLLCYCSVLYNCMLTELSIQVRSGASELNLFLKKFCQNLLELSDSIERILEKKEIFKRKRNGEFSPEGSCVVFVEYQQGAFYFHMPVNVALMRLGYESIMYKEKRFALFNWITKRFKHHREGSGKTGVLFICDENSEYIESIAKEAGPPCKVISIEQLNSINREHYPFVYFTARHYSGNRDHSRLARLLASIQPELVLLGACETAANTVPRGGIISRLRKILDRASFGWVISRLKKEPTAGEVVSYRDPVLGLAYEVVRRGVPYCYGSVWTVFECGISQLFLRALAKIKDSRSISTALCESCRELIETYAVEYGDSRVGDLNIEQAKVIITAMSYICVSGGSNA